MIRDSFRRREGAFLKKVRALERETGSVALDVRVRQLPEEGLVLPEGMDSETARKIVKLYNAVFK